MKLVVAGCSFSDYMEKNDSVYGDLLAGFLGAKYIHHGAGSGSNWRIWREVGNMIYNDEFALDDILIVQYSNNERQEFWSANPPDKDRIINGVKRMNLREQGPEYGSIIRWKFDSHTWLDKPYPKEGKFAKMYQNGHVSQGFTQLQFNAHNLMFQSLLKEKKIKTIFLRSRINEGYDLEEYHEKNCFVESDEDKQNIELRYQPEDPSHLNNKGHLNLAKKLLRHIKELDWK